MLTTGLLILPLMLGGVQDAPGKSRSRIRPPLNNSTYSIGLERVASRILFDRCRVEMVGDSETNHAGVTSTHAEARFHHGAIRTFRPARWRGCTIPAYAAGSYSASGWYYQPNPDVGYRVIQVDADGLPPADISKRTAVGSPGIFTGLPGMAFRGFNTESLFPFEFTGATTSTDWAHRASVPLGGRYHDLVWRSGIGEDPGANQFLEPGARYRWQAWHYVSDAITPGPHPIAHDADGAARIIDDIDLRPTTPHPSYRWTGITDAIREPATATQNRVVRTVWHSIDATLEAGEVPPPPNIPSFESLGPGIEVHPPDGRTWGDLAGPESHAMLLMGGFVLERLDQDGLFLASLGNDGFRAVNHLYESEDQRIETSFHPGSGIFNAYSDDALLARYERFETDTVFILLGVNDSNHAMASVHAPSAFVSNLEGIIDRHRRVHAIARDRNDDIQDIRFVIFTQPDWDDGETQRERMSEYAWTLRMLAHRHSDVAVVDLHGRWRDEKGTYGDYAETSLADGAHPTRSGQDAFAAMAWSEIVRAHYGCDVVDPDADGIPDCESCSGDIDSNGVVDGRDFGLFLLDWGTSVARSDLTEDGVVDQADLGMLLSRWGPCF